MFNLFKESPCIKLPLRNPYKIPNVMKFYLSIYNYFIQKYKHLKIDILTSFTAICAKMVGDKAK